MDADGQEKNNGRQMMPTVTNRPEISSVPLFSSYLWGGEALAQQSATADVHTVVSCMCCTCTGSLPAELPLCFICEYSHPGSHRLPGGCLCSFGEMSTMLRSASTARMGFKAGRSQDVEQGLKSWSIPSGKVKPRLKQDRVVGRNQP